MNIIAADLKFGYNMNSVKDKMDFINRLPYECKVMWIEEIERSLSNFFFNKPSQIRELTDEQK